MRGTDRAVPVPPASPLHAPLGGRRVAGERGGRLHGTRHGDRCRGRGHVADRARADDLGHAAVGGAGHRRPAGQRFEQGEAQRLVLGGQEGDARRPVPVDQLVRPSGPEHVDRGCHPLAVLVGRGQHGAGVALTRELEAGSGVALEKDCKRGDRKLGALARVRE